MERTGIYGGTFNPMHNGHIQLLLQFAKKLQLTRILLIPTGTPPHKAYKSDVSAVDRLEMCRLCTKQLVGLEVTVSDMEITRGGKSYTADTLLLLRRQYPDDEFYLIMGEDMFLTVEKWVRPQVIFSQAVICAAPRSDDGGEALRRHAAAITAQYPFFRCRIENIPYLPVSSTGVRQAVQRGESIAEMVSPEVMAYIAQHGLYRMQAPAASPAE